MKTDTYIPYMVLVTGYRSKTMKKSLRTQMLIQYVAIVIICMLIIPAAISELLDRQFRRFASERLIEDQQEIVMFMHKTYTRGDSWNSAVLSDIRGDILRWPMMRAVLYDADGNLVRDFTRQIGRVGGTGIIPGRMDIQNIETSKRHRQLPELVIKDEPIVVRGENVGTIRFLCLPFNDSREGVFLKQFNRHMYYAIALMLFVAVLISFVMADRISRPVLNVSKRAFLISKGNYRMTEEMTSDITELQTMIESINRLGFGLEEQENLRKRLMSDIAHELRNPLTIIKSHLEAFEDGVWEPSPERLKLTVGEIDRLSMLISEIEKLTSIENMGKSLLLNTADLSEEIKKIALALDPLYCSKSVLLSLQIESDIMASVDIMKIRQAVENLLSNALRYTDQGGSVLLEMRQNGNNFDISVQDSGIGISEDDIPYIFERFYRTDRSRARESGGMGIGLAICKAIVEAHTGKILVESKEGVGSKFTISIPMDLKG